MRRILMALLLSLLGVPPALAQVGPRDPSSSDPRFTAAFGYQNVRANAPPGVCNCFDMNGGFASVGVQIKSWLSAAGEVTGGHAQDIGPLGQDLTLTTYTAGPRITLPGRRFTPFVQALFGAAHGSDSYFPTASGSTTSATSFALSTGGGLDIHLNQHLAIRAVQAQYLRTSFPDGSTNFENHVMLGAGVVFTFHNHAKAAAHGARISPDPAPTSAPEPAQATQAPPTPAPEPPAPGVAPVTAAASTPAPTAPPPQTVDEGLFQANVKDIYFDFNSFALRPDAQAVLTQTANFLNAHPNLQVAVDGYTDARGSNDYNYVLGKQRANAARDALASKGVSQDRLQVMSFGKKKQVCTSPDDNCFQENRRVGFQTP